MPDEKNSTQSRKESQENGSLQPPAHDIYHKQRQEWLKQKDTSTHSTEHTSFDPSQEEHSNNWLVFMVVSIVGALIVFMLIPWIENFIPQEQVTSALENIKIFISFSAPVFVIVAAIAGAAGYFNMRHVAWFTLFGHVAGYILFASTLQGAPQSLNFGVYWIVMASLLGGLTGCAIQFIVYAKKKIRKELLPLLFIGFAASLVACFFVVRYTTQQNVEFLSYTQVAERVGYQLYEPEYLPTKLRSLDPKIFVEDGVVSVYYGDDHYPPPPVIDFLSGIELVQSKKVDDMTEDILDPEPGVVFVEIDDSVMARFSERRGRATIEWNKNETHLVLNIYSNIPAREMFTIARSLTAVDSIGN